MSGFLAVGNFLSALFFSLLLFILWLRIFLRYYKISILHPLGQPIFKYTNPIINPLIQIAKRFIPNITGIRYDWVTFVVIIIVECLKFIVLGLLNYRQLLPSELLTKLVLADLIIQPCNLLFFALFIRVLMSWIMPLWQHPLLTMITNPLIRIGHKIVPNISGFDFSPFIMMVILKIITLFITATINSPLL